MKWYKILLMVVLLLTVSRVSADNLEVADMEMIPGEAKEMLLSLNNPSDQYTAFQLDLILPEEVTIAKDANGTLMVTLDKDRIKADAPHTLTVSQLTRSGESATTTYRLVVYSSSNLDILGNSGPLLHVTLQANDEASSGENTVRVANQVFTQADGTQQKWQDVTAKVTIVLPVVTADNKERQYGDENPAFTYTASIAPLGEPELTSTATKTSPVGVYDIVVGKGSVKGNFTAVNGKLTITKAPLTITAKSYTITQGDELPAFDAKYSGFKNDETEAILTKKPTLSTSVTSSSEPGTFDIVASGAEAVNYGITYVKGTLTIKPGVYKLVYMVDGEVYKSFEVVYGTAITPEPAPTKEGYNFSGWSEIPATMPAHDVTVTGSFSKGQFKLVYVVDGKTYKTISYDYGDAITPEPAPSKEGYSFSGWSEIPATMPAHDVTVTGSFTINKYKLTYMVDGAVYKTYDVEYGATITPEAEPTKEGYTFSGWSEIPATMPAHDVTVTGSFTVNKYKLTYLVDGVEYKAYDVEYGATITPEAEPTKEGYTFSGWSEIPATMPAHDVTVTGSFSKGQFKLIYVVDGKTYKTISYDYGDAITPEPAPTKEGYTFSGWSEIPATMPAHDVTVTGSFTVNKYKVNYFVDANPYYTDMVEYGAAIVPPTVAEREGYTFAWGYIPDTMPAYDISIYGQYTVKTGIDQLVSDSAGGAMIFTIDGKRIDKPRKGLNIVRTGDGKTIKKIVK